MGRGGFRPGAGRKPGARDRTAEAREVVERHAAAMGDTVPADIARMTPLEVMLRAMTLKAAAGSWEQAAGHAAAAAPYVHPKLSSTDLNANVRRVASDFTDDELAILADQEGGEGGDCEAEGCP